MKLLVLSFTAALTISLQFPAVADSKAPTQNATGDAQASSFSSLYNQNLDPKAPPRATREAQPNATDSAGFSSFSSIYNENANPLKLTPHPTYDLNNIQVPTPTPIGGSESSGSSSSGSSSDDAFTTLKEMQDTVVKQQIKKMEPKFKENLKDIQGMDVGSLAPSTDQAQRLAQGEQPKSVGLSEGPERGVSITDAYMNRVEVAMMPFEHPQMCNGNGNRPLQFWMYYIPPTKIPVEYISVIFGPFAPYVAAYLKACGDVKLFLPLGPFNEGFCFRLHPDLPACPVKITVRSLVDYYYPAAIADTSRDPLVSRFLPSPIAEINMGLLNELIPDMVSASASTDIQTASTLEQLNVAGLTGKTQSGTDSGGISDKAISDALAAIKSVPSGLKLISPDAQQMYFRTFPDLMNYASKEDEDLKNVPHIYQANSFGTDMLVGPQLNAFLGYPFSHFLMSSLLDTKRMELLMVPASPVTPGGLFTCLANNKMKLKGSKYRRAPLDLLTTMTAQKDDDDMCVSGIGQSFPYFSAFEGYTSDRTMRALFMGEKLVTLLAHAKEPLKLKDQHLFIPGADMFWVSGDQKLKSDMGDQCFEDNPKQPWEYKETNSRKLLDTEENWFSHQKLFRGCWGEKGDDDWDFYIPIGSSKVDSDIRLK